MRGEGVAGSVSGGKGVQRQYGGKARAWVRDRVGAGVRVRVRGEAGAVTSACPLTLYSNPR